MRFNTKNGNLKKLGALLSFSVVNLLYMHYYFYVRDLFEADLFVYSILFNFLSVCFDVSILFMLFLLVTRNHEKVSSLLTYVITWLWAMANIVYGDFFDQYISISSLAQIENLFEGIVVDSVVANVGRVELYFVFSFPIFFITYLFLDNISIDRNTWLLFILIPCLSLLITFFVYSGYHFVNSQTRSNIELYLGRVKDYMFVGGNEKNAGVNKMRFHVGCVRYLLSDLYDYLNPRKLTDSEKAEIKDVLNISTGKSTNNTVNPNLKNVAIILLESFLSISSDMKIDNKSVTPFLDSLKHSSNVYYNGHVNSNITLGESGDGQFIYMTGILPCRNKITTGEVYGHSLPALPSILKQHFGVKYTEIVIPTIPKIWMQDKMNLVYGIDNMYCSRNYNQDENGTLTDEQVFDMASNTRKSSNQPFFTMVLSISTHQPYVDILDNSFIINKDTFSEPFRCYLNACHYADVQIRKYLNHLKEIGQYDNTLICIVADHQPNMKTFEMGEKIPQELPLYIINGGFDVDGAYDGVCNQLDIFTTILDILNVNSEWKGLGRSLLSPDYDNVVTPDLYRISELIIEGDYFSN